MVTTNANLAETFRPVGTNSGFRGCDLITPPLPSYEKGKIRPMVLMRIGNPHVLSV